MTEQIPELVETPTQAPTEAPPATEPPLEPAQPETPEAPQVQPEQASAALAAEQSAEAAASAEPDPVRDAREQIKLTEAERAQERVQALEDAQRGLAEFEATLTQREWLLVTGALGTTRGKVAEDAGLRLLALAWVREKRDHGGASWDRLLDMTDVEILAVHGIVVTPEDAEALSSQDDANEAAVTIPQD